MKKLLFIIAGIVLLLIGIMFVLVKGGQKQVIPEPQPSSTTFISTSTDIAATNNVAPTSTVSQLFDAMKIIHNPDVSPDASNPGYYFIGNTPTSTIFGKESTYVIVFQSKTSYFNITLLNEPIKDTRLEAENYLKNILELTNEQMCALSYSLGVPQDVSDKYAGHDLKFSFCPDSTDLQ